MSRSRSSAPPRHRRVCGPGRLAARDAERSSAAFTPRWSRGSSRNQQHHAAAQTRPTRRRRRRSRASRRAPSSATTSGWRERRRRAPPAMISSPKTRPRSGAGSQRAIDARRAREGARLADAEQEAHREQRDEARRAARGRGHRRPPDDDARQRRARAEAVGEPAARDLEQRVGEREGAEHEAHLRVAESPRSGLDRRRRGRDADAIEVGDRDHREREGEQPVARAARRLCLHRGPQRSSGSWREPPAGGRPAQRAEGERSRRGCASGPTRSPAP